MNVWSWVEAHPVFASVVLWPLVTAIVTALFKPRTDAEYVALAATHPFLAKVLRLIGALGLDAPKAMQVIGDLFKRQAPKLIFIGAIVLTTSACAGVNIERAEARAAVLTTAQAVKLGDEACAKYALERIDVELARSCELAYRDARLSLILASDAVDAWDESKRGRTICAVIHAAESLAKTAAEFKKRKIVVPGVVLDALALVDHLGSCDV